MKESAKAMLEKLKEKDEALKDKFDSYVALLSEELEISQELATTLVTDELVNRNEKSLILHNLFSEKVLKKNNCF